MVLPSHLMADLERACGHLIVLAGSRCGSPGRPANCWPLITCWPAPPCPGDAARRAAGCSADPHNRRCDICQGLQNICGDHVRMMSSLRAATARPALAGTTRSATGPSVPYDYGVLSAKATVSGKKIVNVGIASIGDGGKLPLAVHRPAGHPGPGTGDHAGAERASRVSPARATPARGSGSRSGRRCKASVAEVLERCAAARELSRGWFDPWAMLGGFDPDGVHRIRAGRSRGPGPPAWPGLIWASPTRWPQLWRRWRAEPGADRTARRLRRPRHRPRRKQAVDGGLPFAKGNRTQDERAETER